MLSNDMYKDPNKYYIVKPTNKSQGKGIYITNKFSEIPNRAQTIVCEYITNPLLIDDYKFDIRLYVIVTSFHPLKIYLYNDGLVRFATEKYIHPSKTHDNMYMHLTN